MSVSFSNVIRSQIDTFVSNAAESNSEALHVVRYDSYNDIDITNTLKKEVSKRTILTTNPLNISDNRVYSEFKDGDIYLYAKEYKDIQKITRNIERTKAFKELATIEHDLDLVSTHDVLLTLQKNIPLSLIKRLRSNSEVFVKYNAKSKISISRKNIIKGGITLKIKDANINTKDIKAFFKKQIYFSGKHLIDKTAKNFSSMFLGKKTTAYNKVQKTSGRVKKSVSSIIPHNPSKLRDIKQKFTSTIKILQLMQPLVTKYIKQDMDSASYFKTLTGRFTKTSKIGIPNYIGNKLIIPFNYIDNYNSFDDSNSRLYRLGREPSNIIDGAIRKAAKDVVSKKFKIIPIRRSFI